MSAAREPVAADPRALTPFRARVLDYVTKQSGFPFERRVAACFADAGFRTAVSGFYVDPAAGQHREIDVMAWQELQLDEVSFRVSVHIECKHSPEDPWVLFRPRVGGATVERTLRRCYHVTSKGVMPMLTRAALVHRAAHRSAPLWLLSGAGGVGERLRVAAKKSSHDDVAYKALRGALHAAIASTRTVERLHADDLHVYELAIPLVVTGAPLFTYDHGATDDALAAATTSGTVLAATPDVLQRSALVDVVSAWAADPSSADDDATLAAYATALFADIAGLLEALRTEMGRIQQRALARQQADLDE